mgnify:CR=1 FL=1
MEKIFNLKAKEYLSTESGKKTFNIEHFTESAPRYDIATIGLSLGQDKKWKNFLLDKINLELDQNSRCLDLACGTGDIVFKLAKKFPKSQIIGVDITEAMLAIARNKNSSDKIMFFNQDIANLKFANNSLDLITGSYALRNSPNIKKTLEDVYVLLKEKGVCIFLDFAKPSNQVMQKIQYYLLKIWGSMWGLILHKNSEVHGYISESLKDYPSSKSLKILASNIGFKSVQSYKLFFGMIEILRLEK